jgi:hypothetical protein
MERQLDEARDRMGEGNLAALLNLGDTWTVK